MLLTVCICLSFAGMVSASAASVRWTPVEISDELKAEIYENYTQYQYSLDIQSRLDLGMPVQTYEEYAAKHKMEDITFFECVAANKEMYIMYINEMDENGFYPGIDCDRLGDYMFDIIWHGGTDNVYVYYKVLSKWGFDSLEGALKTYRIGIEQVNALLGERIGDLAPFVYSVYDVNRDGTVTVSDVVVLRKKIMTGYAEVRWHDIDSDGAVTVSDVLALRKSIVQ